jgi:hypothetical protein
MISAVVTVAVTIAMTMTVAMAAPGECRAWHREAGRDDQCCGERKLLHSRFLL